MTIEFPQPTHYQFSEKVAEKRIEKKYGVVLAGGQSTRMGQDKAALIYQGKTWLEKAVNLLKNNNFDSVLISRNKELPFSIDQIITPEVSIVQIQDQYLERGPIEGIRQALSFIQAQSTEAESFTLCVLATDMPLVSDIDIQTLTGKEIENNQLICYRQQWLPFYLKSDKASIDAILLELNIQLNAHQSSSIKDFISNFNLLEIEPEFKTEFNKRIQNFNRPEQWAKATAKL